MSQRPDIPEAPRWVRVRADRKVYEYNQETREWKPLQVYRVRGSTDTVEIAIDGRTSMPMLVFKDTLGVKKSEKRIGTGFWTIGADAATTTWQHRPPNSKPRKVKMPHPDPAIRNYRHHWSNFGVPASGGRTVRVAREA